MQELNHEDIQEKAFQAVRKETKAALLAELKSNKRFIRVAQKYLKGDLKCN